MIGREDTFSNPTEIGADTIKKFAMAIGDRNPLYWDEDFAKKTRYGGIVAPPTMLFELNHDIEAEISEKDGGYYDTFLTSLKTISNRFVRGGNDYDIIEPVRPHDMITIKRKISQIQEKIGKTGPLLIVTIEIMYTNQRGKLLGINRENMIFLSPKPDKEKL